MGRSAIAAGWLRVAASVAFRPVLWTEGARQVHLLAGRRWWRRASRLPVPDAAWARFRLTTQLGTTEGVPEPAEIVAWLRWCRSMRDLR